MSRPREERAPARAASGGCGMRGGDGLANRPGAEATHLAAFDFSVIRRYFPEFSFSRLPCARSSAWRTEDVDDDPRDGSVRGRS